MKRFNPCLFTVGDFLLYTITLIAIVVSGTYRNAYLYWKTIGGDKLDDARKLMNEVA